MLNKTLLLPQGYSGNYRFSFSRQENHKNKNLSFSMNIRQGEIPQYKNPVVQLTRSNLQINHEKPDETLLGELISKSSEVLYPLELILTQTGYLDTVSNSGEIRSRWKKKKEKLSPEYDNEISVELIERIGKLYETPQKLLSGLKNDWFYSVFFLPIFQNYKENRYSFKYAFPVFPYGKIAYNLELKLVEKENGKIEIWVKGCLENDEKESLSGTYILNPDHSIHSAHLQFSFPLQEETIEIKIQEEDKKPDYKEVGFLYDLDKEQEEKEKSRNSPSFFLEERDLK